MNEHEYFMGIAYAVSRKSHCLSHQFGAIAVNDDRQILSTGYNGPPRGYPHCSGYDKNIPQICPPRYHTDIWCPRREAGFQSGQGLEWCPAAHAERNVLINAARYGVRLKGCRLYITSPTPCRECAKEIVNAGISEVIYADGHDYPEIGITGRRILEECGVKLWSLKDLVQR